MLSIRHLLDIVSGRNQSALATITRAFLYTLTPFYWMGWCWKNRKFRNGNGVLFHPRTPTISVGNLTTGGTGKTPMVLWLCQHIGSRSLKPMILSRGYKKTNNSKSTRGNDEFQELAIRMPGVEHRQAANRAELAREVEIEGGIDVFILDDGFQHRQLDRNLDLVLIDATCPFGYGHLIPRGLLREPVSQLTRADAIVITRCDQIQSSELDSLEQLLAQKSGNKSIFKVRNTIQSIANQTERQPFETLAGKRVLLFAGIGNPENFEFSMRQQELDVIHCHWFDDHHNYCKEDLRLLVEKATANDCDHLLCTLKDFVKIAASHIGGIPLWAVIADLEFVDGQSRFEALIDGVVENAILKKNDSPSDH